MKTLVQGGGVIVIMTDLIYLYVLRALLKKILLVYTRCAYKGRIYRTEWNRMADARFMCV